MHDSSPQYFYRKGHRNRFFTSRYSIIIAIVGLLCTGLLFTPNTLSLNSLAFSTVSASSAKGVDTIIVLGGGLTSDGLPPLWQQARCKLAAELYSKATAGGQSPAPVVITLSGGTTWKAPPRDDRGFPITEAASSARYLATLGVPYEHLFEEGFSLDTIGNAYFLRAMHTDVAGWRRLEVCSVTFTKKRIRKLLAICSYLYFYYYRRSRRVVMLTALLPTFIFFLLIATSNFTGYH